MSHITKKILLASILAFLALAAQPARAADLSWTGGDVLRQGAFTALVITDWATTVSTNDPWHGERNPLLGRHPSNMRITLAAVGGATGHALVSALLPRPWRQMWQVGGIVAEFLVVGNNVAVGGSF